MSARPSASDTDHEAVHLLSLQRHSDSSSPHESDTISDDGHAWRDGSLDLQHEPEPKDVEILDSQDPLSTTATAINTRAMTLWHSVRPRIKPLLFFLVPSFISSLFSPSDLNASKGKLRPTAYLDGLRGVAAYMVFNTHVVGVVNMTIGGGYQPGDEGSYLIQLPIVRLIYSGYPAVCIFFVVSGFALSIGPVKDMNQPNPQASLKSLSSSIFRRPIRLLLPAWASTFIVYILVRGDAFNKCAALIVDKTVLAGFPNIIDWPAPTGSFIAQFFDLWAQNLRPFALFHSQLEEYFSNKYNPVLWTIAIEFRGSLILYVTHAAVYYLRRRYRVGVVVGLVFLTMLLQSFELPLFWSGYLLAELNYWQRSDSAALTIPFGEQHQRKLRWAKTAIFSLVFLVGCFLASDPPWEPEKNYFYSGLTSFTPSFYYATVQFWVSAGAVMIILAIGQLPLVARCFAISPIQYLGKISFSLYLVHIWIVRGVGTLIFYEIYKHTAQTGSELTALFGFFAAYFSVLGICIWLADIFWRAIDDPCVWLGKVLVQRMFREAKTATGS